MTAEMDAASTSGLESNKNRFLILLNNFIDLNDQKKIEITTELILIKMMCCFEYVVLLHTNYPANK